MKRSLSMYSLSAVGAVVLMLSACGKKEEPKAAAPAPATAAAPAAGPGGIGNRDRGEEVDRQRIPAVDAVEGPADGRDEVVHRGRGQAQGQGRERDLGRVRDDHHARVRKQDPGQGVRRDHRHHRQARPDPGRRRGRKAADLDAIGQVDLRRLDLRLRPDRHALPLRQDPGAVGLHGRRGQGVHQPGSGPEGLHRHELHHRARQEALPAARPAVRQPVLVPRRLVRPAGAAGQVQGQVWLRPGRAAELERV